MDGTTLATPGCSNAERRRARRTRARRSSASASAEGPASVSSLRRFESLFAENDGVDVRVHCLDAPEVRLDDFLTRDFLRSDRIGEIGGAHAVVRGDDLPPLHGVPFTVKQNIDLAGTPTTMGIKALAASYPTVDAPNVERIRAAGAIPIGRTNCPDLAIRWHADSELWGATVNPWDRSRTPGGSSGGEAAALATGMSPLGLGNDMGGSLRRPAQCCGISSLKPTLGHIPHATSIASPISHPPISIQLMAS